MERWMSQLEREAGKKTSVWRKAERFQEEGDCLWAYEFF
jgi:hypothetical protein